jgi:acetyl esterase/lipase
MFLHGGRAYYRATSNFRQDAFTRLFHPSFARLEFGMPFVLRSRYCHWGCIAALLYALNASTGVAQTPSFPTAQRLQGNVEVLRDICYSTVGDVQLLCDVYRPLTSTSQASTKLPAVLLVHGGGWASGDKWAVAIYGKSLAEKGIIAVAINYRHAPEFKFPTQVDDCRAALVWMVDHADDFQLDTNRIGMFGYSAGAHLSCMIGTLCDAQWQEIAATTEWPEQDPRWQKIPAVCGIVGGGAPCEFRDLPIDNTTIAYFLGGSRREIPQTYLAASPASHASSGDVPTLFFHGTRDLIVPIASSQVLYNAQKEAGVNSRFVSIDGLGHMLTFLHPTAIKETVEFFVSELLMNHPENHPSAVHLSEVKTPEAPTPKILPATAPLQSDDE